MGGLSRHLPVERLGGPDPLLLHPSNNVALDGVEAVEFAVEMAGEQQHRVLKLALAVRQRARAEAYNRTGGADHDGGDQQYPAENQETERIALPDRCWIFEAVADRLGELL